MKIGSCVSIRVLPGKIQFRIILYYVVHTAAISKAGKKLTHNLQMQ